MTQPVFAVGDIHGQAGELDRVLDLIAADPARGAPVVFLGDYVDRGPDSRGVLDRLAGGPRHGETWITLLGNHDRYFRDFLSGEMTERDWQRWLSDNLGGRATLASYGIDAFSDRDLGRLQQEARAVVPPAHRALLDRLAPMHVTEAQVFVHAGIRPGVPLDRQLEHDLIWIREGFLDDRRDHGRLVVHGHTSVEGPALFPNRLNLDGGAAFGRPLCAALIEGRSAWLLTASGRLRL
ncbi:metallophosphoesterase family protein [Roseivivax sp. CAU 1761]